MVVLRQGAENYRNLCREKRFVVRPFKFDPAEDKAERERKETLAGKKKKLWVRFGERERGEKKEWNQCFGRVQARKWQAFACAAPR